MSVAREERTGIAGPEGNIEVGFYPSGEGALAGQGYCAVVCHPHPLHGGTMDNKVVTTLVRAYRELGVPVARFNFRGVGASEGVHDNGVGEVGDLRAVADWFRDKTGASRLLVAGFSFGTGVAGNFALAESAVAQVVFVAPPVGRYNFAPALAYPMPVCVVMGDQDELVDAAEVYQWADTLEPRPALIRIPEATHFFHGQLVTMRQRLVTVIKSQLGVSESE